MFALAGTFAGIAPAAALGAPIYAALSTKGWANLGTVTVASLVPGLLLVPFVGGWGALTGVFGLPVAWCLHLIARRRLAEVNRHSSNNSSKPTPLRGAA